MSNVLRKENLIYFFINYINYRFLHIKRLWSGIEEHFQRKSGFYWLNYLLNFTDFNSLKASTLLKLKDRIFYSNLYPIEQVPYYGIIFDLPLAFIEVIFKIENHTEYFY